MVQLGVGLARAAPTQRFSVDRFHVQGVAENEGNVFTSAEIRQPVPREDAFDGDDNALPERCDRSQKRIQIGLHITVQYDGAGRACKSIPQ